MGENLEEWYSPKITARADDTKRQLKGSKHNPGTNEDEELSEVRIDERTNMEYQEERPNKGDYKEGGGRMETTRTPNAKTQTDRGAR